MHIANSMRQPVCGGDRKQGIAKKWMDATCRRCIAQLQRDLSIGLMKAHPSQRHAPYCEGCDADFGGPGVPHRLLKEGD